MKKMLAILGAFGLTATGATIVFACNKETSKKDTLGGLQASDFEEVLLGTQSKDFLNNEVIMDLYNDPKSKQNQLNLKDNLLNVFSWLVLLSH